MEKLTVFIVDCPINSFKLEAENIHQHYSKALENARELYLNLHDEAYRDLMFKDFNPLWTPDRQATNDIDSKDGFWSMYIFFFNISLIEILSKKYSIEIFDQTSSEFRNQKHFFKYLKNKGIDIKINQEKCNNKSIKHSVKVFVKNTFFDIKKSIYDTVQFFKQEFIESHPPLKITFKNREDSKIIYLAVPPVNKTDIKFYLSWRYKKIFRAIEKFQKRGFRILLVSIKDYEGLKSLDFPSINAIRLVGKKEKLDIFVLSIWYKLRVFLYKWYKLLTSSDPVRNYFFKNIPTDLYFALQENRAFDNLFKTYGRGLWIMKGPTVYKGIAMRNYNAWKNGVRALTVSGRFMTSTRLTNSFLKSHTDDHFFKVLPDSIFVRDTISLNTIKKQTDKITIYIKRMLNKVENKNSPEHQPFSVTLILQKKNEMESMIDSVYSATKDLKDVVLYLKAHPDFPIPKKIREKYSKKKGLHILAIDTSLQETVEMSSLCISSYSSAVFEFAKYGKPIIWLNHVTLNSLLVADVQKKIGLTVNNDDELKQLIQKMKNDFSFYQKSKEKQMKQLNEFINEIDENMNDSLSSIIEKELNKI